MASEQPARFTRSVYDVDRQQVSPFEWRRWEGKPRRYVRRMGLVESFFNTMGTLHEGRTDIFYRLPLRCPAAASDQLLQQLPLAWAVLCRRHPLLCARVANLTPDLQEVDAQEANEKRQAGESSHDASVSFEPHFVIDYPRTAPELINKASDRIVWLPPTWSKSVSEKNPSEAAVQWLEAYVWNGKRRFLRQYQAFGLASLVVLPPIAKGDLASFDIVLLAAHCIGDGLSMTQLAAELLAIVIGKHLPSQIPQLVHRPETERNLKHATLATYPVVTQHMSAIVAGDNNEPTSDDLLCLSELECALPPCLEAAYPSMILTQTSSDTHQSRISRRARLRWFWSIRRIICQSRALKAQIQVLSDFKAERDNPIPEPWWGAQTTWSVVRIPQNTTSVLTQWSKRKRVRVGALLYSIATLALNTLEKESCNSAPRSNTPNQTVIGFPMSIRKYLDAVSPIINKHEPSLERSLGEPSSLGVRLGFGGVALPPADLFALPSTRLEEARQLSSYQTAQIWQVGRQAQRQFDIMFRHPHLLVADGFVMALERENRFRQGGVQDVFQNTTEQTESGSSTVVAGADERQPGVTKKNMQGPGSSLNFSMLGMLDYILPCTLPLPSFMQGGELEVAPNLVVGVRNRAGEAFGTSFTFRGQLNLELGHDAVVWDTDKVQRFLFLMEGIIAGLVAQ